MSDERATRFVWAACGSPAPYESTGELIREREMGTHCASCGHPARYRLDDAISDNFMPARNINRLFPHGGEGLCAACVWSFKSMLTRSGLAFARESGVWFVSSLPLAGVKEQRRPDPIAAILSPPEAPFVAWYPRYGVEHGTEGNCARTVWPGCPVPADPLTKCQSKHTLPYARVSYRRDRYPLQVDDAGELLVEVARWLEARALIEALWLDLRAAGVGSDDCRDAVRLVEPPPHCPLPLLADWRRRTAPLRSSANAPWLAFLAAYLPMPPLPEKRR